MKIKRARVEKLRVLIESARILVDDATPIGGYRQHKLEQAYDLLLEADELLTKKEGKHDGKCRLKGSFQAAGRNRQAVVG